MKSATPSPYTADVVRDFLHRHPGAGGENRFASPAPPAGRPRQLARSAPPMPTSSRGGTHDVLRHRRRQKPSCPGEAVVFSVAQRLLGWMDFSETSIELIGAESQFGKFGTGIRQPRSGTKLAARHLDAGHSWYPVSRRRWTVSPPPRFLVSSAAAPNLPGGAPVLFHHCESQWLCVPCEMAWETSMKPMASH